MTHDIKRMLELAAKAVGKQITWVGDMPTIAFDLEEQANNPGVDGYQFQPHERGGECMFLITELGLLVEVDWDSRTATAVVPDRLEMIRNIVHIVNIPEGSDGMAETRLAVLMAAAAVGEAMP